MNTSQSSDIFPEYLSHRTLSQSQGMAYNDMISKTKELLLKPLEEADESLYVDLTLSTIEDASVCIIQGLDLITCTAEQARDSAQVSAYLDDMVVLMQMLAKFVRDRVESTCLTCAVYKDLPLTTGHIILKVFTHCRDSESVYREWLSAVELPLKELFRSCNELQQVYLTLLEKNLTFELNNEEELHVLVEALKINLNIGEAVVKLDLKTMAEQWKALMALCERYADHLMGEEVAAHYADSLCFIIRTNISSIMEEDLEHRQFIRSLKVTSFLMKILVKLCQIFKKTVTQDYEQVVLLLVAINSLSEAYLRSDGKSAQFIQQVTSHVTVGADSLLNELISDDAFASCILRLDVQNFEENELVLGYLLLLVAVMTMLLHKDENGTREVWLSGDNIICSMFKVMPHSHFWLNYGLQLDCRSNKTESVGHWGLYELMLTSTGALAATVDAEQYEALEQSMYLALLQTDCWTALFASDLWVMLARFAPPDLCYGQFYFLVETYRELDHNNSLYLTPQHVHLKKTIQRLFNTMPDEDRIKVFETYKVQNEDHAAVWQAVQVKSLPETQAITVKSIVLRRMKMQLKKLQHERPYTDSDMKRLIQTLQLAATCHFTSTDEVPKEDVVTGWLKSCLKSHSGFYAHDEVASKMWFMEYVKGLSALTCILIEGTVLNNGDLTQILDVILYMAENTCSALKICFIKILTSLSHYVVQQDTYTEPVSQLIALLFRQLLTDNQHIVKSKAFVAFKIFCYFTNQEEIIPYTVKNDENLTETVINFISNDTFTEKQKSISWKEQMKFTSELKYSHCCYQQNLISKVLVEENIQIQNSSKNFELEDIEIIFDEASDSDDLPVSKKVKLDTTEAEAIINRIESDVHLLASIRENVFSEEHKCRINSICQQLTNIS